MKKIKNLLMLMFICTMLIKEPVYAETGSFMTITPFYTHISATTTALTITSGSASCQSSIIANSSSAELKIFMYLEKQINGVWTQYGSWYTTKTGSSLTLTKNVSVSSGTYRVKASYYSNGENTVKYSATKTF